MPATIKEILSKLFPDKKADIDLLPEPEVPAAAPAPAPDAEKKEETQQQTNDLAVQIQSLIHAVTKLTEKNNALEATFQASAQAEQQKKIDELITKAIADKKIPAQNDEIIKTYKAMAAKDFDGTAAIIAAVNPIVGDAKDSQKPQTAGGSQKTGNKRLEYILQTTNLTN
jgi:hypothetical protein